MKLTIPRNRFFPLSTKAENSRKNSNLKEFKSILADVAPLHKKNTHVPSPWLKPVSLINMIIVYIFQQTWARLMVIKHEKLAVKHLGRVGSIYHYNIQILAIEIHKVYSNVSQVIFSDLNKRSNLHS